MRFVFRADGSSAIGLGHLSRMATLALAARAEGHDVRMACARPEAEARSFVMRRALELEVLDVEPGTDADAAATRAVAGRDALVVIDGYVFTSGWLSGLGGAERTIAYVDDQARDSFTCDAVINPNVSGTAALYTSSSSALLVGPQYALVDERFVNARQQKTAPGPEPRRLLVTMGGSDPPGATLAVLAALASHAGLEVRVVVGGANARKEEIRELCRERGYELRLAVEDMASEMIWADLAVTASGVTATEIACVGLPGVTFPIVDNQAPIAAALDRLGLFAVLPRSPEPAAIADAIGQLLADGSRRQAMVVAQRRTIDGGGARRVIAALLALAASRRHNSHAGGNTP
jgi:UDP-2,4-diacetamido-2,4,6-trideoxy-beta-L-altropyranose hydrolase